MARVVKNGGFTVVYGTAKNGEDVRLASLRTEFNRADYDPRTCPPRLIELQDTGHRKAGCPQTIACFIELGERVGQSRFVKVPVMEKAPDIVAALTQAGFSAPPVKTPLAARVTGLIEKAIEKGRHL